MGLLKSIDNVPGINFYEYRDEPYYGKYLYRMRVQIPCVRYTWWCKKPEDLDTKMSGKFHSYGNIKKQDLQTVRDNEQALKAIIVIQTERKKTKKIAMRIEASTVAFFSDDLAELQKIEKTLGGGYNCDYTEVQTSQYAGIKHFVNEPKHKFRIYLRSKRVDDTFHVELSNTIGRTKTLYPSPALIQWMKRDPKRYGIWHFRWTSSAHFIDYDDESTLSYLALMHGDVLGKKYKLEKRPDNI